jgi:hypothetical protein
MGLMRMPLIFPTVLGSAFYHRIVCYSFVFMWCWNASAKNWVKAFHKLWTSDGFKKPFPSGAYAPLVLSLTIIPPLSTGCTLSDALHRLDDTQTYPESDASALQAPLREQDGSEAGELETSLLTGETTTGTQPTSTADSGAAEPQYSGQQDAGTVEDEPELEPDNAQAPTIVSVTPEAGSIGVRKDTSLTVTFNVAMNTELVEASFTSNDLDMRNAVFSWNETNSSLTISLAEPLSYATGNDVGTVVPISYEWGFSAIARSGKGVPLNAASFSFSTLRAITSKLSPLNQVSRSGNWTSEGHSGAGSCDALSGNLCVGDGSVAQDAQYKAFLSFNLNALDTEAEVESASLVLPLAALLDHPFASLGALSAETLQFDGIDDNAFSLTGTGASPLVWGGVETSFTADVTSVVQGQLSTQARSQFRAVFEYPTDYDGRADVVVFAQSTCQLVITQLIP